MKTPLISLAKMSLVLSTSACGSLMNPDIRQNPHPKMRYDITMTIEGAPSPFDSVNGHMQYDISNERCAPEDNLAGYILCHPLSDCPLPSCGLAMVLIQRRFIPTP
jgi:hypothetical protein